MFLGSSTMMSYLKEALVSLTQGLQMHAHGTAYTYAFN